MPRDFCLKDILNNEFGQDKPKNARVGSLVSNMITGPFAPLANPNVSKEKVHIPFLHSVTLIACYVTHTFGRDSQTRN